MKDRVPKGAVDVTSDLSSGPGNELNLSCSGPNCITFRVERTNRLEVPTNSEFSFIVAGGTGDSSGKATWLSPVKNVSPFGSKFRDDWMEDGRIGSAPRNGRTRVPETGMTRHYLSRIKLGPKRQIIYVQRFTHFTPITTWNREPQYTLMESITYIPRIVTRTVYRSQTICSRCWCYWNNETNNNNNWYFTRVITVKSPETINLSLWTSGGSCTVQKIKERW